MADYGRSRRSYQERHGNEWEIPRSWEMEDMFAGLQKFLNNTRNRELEFYELEEFIRDAMQGYTGKRRDGHSRAKHERTVTKQILNGIGGLYR